MKSFLKDEVEKGTYNGVSVKWERGHPVTLVLYDEEDAEIERHNVEGWEVQKVRDTLKLQGFHAHTRVLPKPGMGRLALFTHVIVARQNTSD
jgi:hypothetical protein